MGCESQSSGSIFSCCCISTKTKVRPTDAHLDNDEDQTRNVLNGSQPMFDSNNEFNFKSHSQFEDDNQRNLRKNGKDKKGEKDGVFDR